MAVIWYRSYNGLQTSNNIMSSEMSRNLLRSERNGAVCMGACVECRIRYNRQIGKAANLKAEKDYYLIEC